MPDPAAKEGADHQETMEEILELLAKRSLLCRQDIEEFRSVGATAGNERLFSGFAREGGSNHDV